MKQIHKLKELNRKLEDALKKIDALAEKTNSPFTKEIRAVIDEALDKKGNRH